MRYHILNKSWKYFLPLMVVLIYSLVRSIRFRIHDFVNYYYGAKHVLIDAWANEIYNADYFNRWITEQFDVSSFASYYPNPPSLSLIYSPIGMLDPVSAKLVVNMIGVLLFLAMIVHIQRSDIKVESWSILLFPFIFFIPFKNNILFGQSYLILLGLIYFGYVAVKNNKISLGSLAWPCAILLKASPIVLLGLPLLQKKFKSFGVLIIGLAFLFCMSLNWIEIEDWMHYLTEIMPSVSQGDLYNGFSHQSKSWMMLFKLMMVPEPMLNPNPLIANSKLFFASNLFFKFMVLMIVLGITYRSKNIDLKLIALWLSSLLLISPTLSSYSMVLLVPAYFVITKDFKTMSSYFGLGMLLLICCYPSHWFSDRLIFLSFGRAILLLGFFILFLRNHFRVDLAIVLKSALVIAIVVSLLSYFTKEELSFPNNYFLKSEPHIMMVDFELNGEDLIASYKTRNGIEQIRTRHELNIKKVKRLPNLPPQILVNDSLIIYMTDLNRSPGFYTLRKKLVDDTE